VRSDEWTQPSKKCTRVSLLFAGNGEPGCLSIIRMCVVIQSDDVLTLISEFLPMKWISLAIGPKGKYWCEIECAGSRGSVKLEISPELYSHLRTFKKVFR
jgi:hypothetical protein